MVWTAVTFQLGVLGGTGALFLASTVLAAVIWFHDPMSGFKTLALVITVWGVRVLHGWALLFCQENVSKLIS